MTSADTKRALVDAALRALRERGYAGASAREIAAAGNLNQALIFYHYGSVKKLLLAALDLVSDARMDAYRARFEGARSISELTALAREIYDEDLRHGYVTVLGELVGGGVSDPELGREVVARIEPWIELVQAKLGDLLGGSPLAAIVPARDVAFAIVALYLGTDMLGHLEGDHGRGESLLELAARYGPLADELLGFR